MTEELILQIDVTCTGAEAVDGHLKKVVMVDFNGTTEGKYFTGKVIGTGVDTQKYPKDSNGNFIEGAGTLSARYMLEGKDYTGQSCRIFVENNAGPDGWIPTITTDSNALSAWENEKLRSSVDPTEKGVLVSIYKIS